MCFREFVLKTISNYILKYINIDIILNVDYLFVYNYHDISTFFYKIHKLYNYRLVLNMNIL